MLIKEVEAITGITKRNIRFYEKEGLLSPDRSSENKYRQYTHDDIRRLKEIKMLRKLGVGLSDIKSVQSGAMTLSECIEKYLSFYTSQKTDLEKIIELCTVIQKQETDLRSLNTDFYISKLDSTEQGKLKHTNIANDFITKARGVLPIHPKFFFEPDEPIMDQFEFVSELEKYAERKNKSLTIISMGMRPTIMLDGQRYICALEMPRYLHFPFSIFFVTKMNFGYRFVYFYEDYPNTW